MSGRCAAIEPVKEGIVSHVDEELRAAAFGLACVGHRESSRGVGNLLREFIGDTSSGVSLVGLSVASLEGAGRRRTSCSSATTDRIFGIRTTELVHEIGNDSVKVNPIVEAPVRQIDEVPDSNRHLVIVELSLEGAHRSFEYSSLGHLDWGVKVLK